MNKNNIDISQEDFLKELIVKLLGVDVRLAKTRKRNVVNARMIYSYILRERGWSYKGLGRNINKDHSTIIHYVKNIKGYMKSDVELRDSFRLVVDKFESYRKSDLFLTEDELKSELIHLRTDNKNLSLELDVLKLQLKSHNEKQLRLRTIYSIINSRTPRGQEQKIEGLINRMYNGVHS